MSVVIEYTHTVKLCIDDIASHLRRIQTDPTQVISGILNDFENRVANFPLSCQFCPELLKIGCAKYREYNTTDGYRILYSVEENTIIAHALLSHKQDIQQLLFKRLISI